MFATRVVKSVSRICCLVAFRVLVVVVVGGVVVAETAHAVHAKCNALS